MPNVANVAQSVEQTLRKRPVEGSNPPVGFFYLINLGAAPPGCPTPERLAPADILPAD